MRNKSLVIVTILALMIVPQFVFADASPDGGAVFKAKCASCHGPDGKAQTSVGKAMKIGDLASADIQKMSDADLAKVIEDGKGKMPAYKGKLSTDEINAVVKFIRSLKK